MFIFLYLYLFIFIFIYVCIFTYLFPYLLLLFIYLFVYLFIYLFAFLLMYLHVNILFILTYTGKKSCFQDVSFWKGFRNPGFTIPVSFLAGFLTLNLMYSC